MYWFWLPFWYLQTLLMKDHSTYVFKYSIELKIYINSSENLDSRLFCLPDWCHRGFPDRIPFTGVYQLLIRCIELLELGVLKWFCIRQVWKYQKVNQKPSFKDGQTNQLKQFCLNNNKKERITIQYDNLDKGYTNNVFILFYHIVTTFNTLKIMS